MGLLVICFSHLAEFLVICFSHLAEFLVICFSHLIEFLVICFSHLADDSSSHYKSYSVSLLLNQGGYRLQNVVVPRNE